MSSTTQKVNRKPSKNTTLYCFACFRLAADFYGVRAAGDTVMVQLVNPPEAPPAPAPEAAAMGPEMVNPFDAPWTRSTDANWRE